MTFTFQNSSLIYQVSKSILYWSIFCQCSYYATGRTCYNCIKQKPNQAGNYFKWDHISHLQLTLLHGLIIFVKTTSEICSLFIICHFFLITQIANDEPHQVKSHICQIHSHKSKRVLVQPLYEHIISPPKLVNNEAIPAIIQIPIVNPPNEQTNETSDADHISCKQMFDNYYNIECSWWFFKHLWYTEYTNIGIQHCTKNDVFHHRFLHFLCSAEYWLTRHTANVIQRFRSKNNDWVWFHLTDDNSDESETDDRIYLGNNIDWWMLML